MRAFTLSFLIVAIALTGCQNQKRAAKGFDSIRASIIEGDFKNSIPKLEQFVAKNPDSKDASRAGLFLFKCNAAIGDLDKAKQWCDWTIKNYATSLEAHKCRYKLAMIALWKHDIESAKAQFDALAKQPDGPLAAEAKQMFDFLTGTQFAKQNANGE